MISIEKLIMAKRIIFSRAKKNCFCHAELTATVAFRAIILQHGKQVSILILYVLVEFFLWWKKLMMKQVCYIILTGNLECGIFRTATRISTFRRSREVYWNNMHIVIFHQLMLQSHKTSHIDRVPALNQLIEWLSHQNRYGAMWN